MAKISTYPILSNPTINDILIGTDVEDLNITKNFSIGSIVDIVGNEFVPYVGATGNVNLGAFNITATSFIVAGGLSSQFLKANGTLDSTVYVSASRTLTINSVTYDLSANRSWDLNTIDTLTTIGTSGAATYIGKTLNIPQYQAQGSYITQLSGEATAVGPGNATVTLSNLAVISKVLTGLNITGGTISDTDSILTAFGKVQNQINGLAGGVTYEGTWNAATNTPTLTSSVGVQGHYYVVSVAGNTNLNGITDWQLGDWAIFNGSVWEKVDNTDAVVSVNGYTGAVVLTFSDVGAPPATRTLTINGTTFDLTANRSWTVGDVRTDQTYSNPTWISSLAWGKITGTPTTLAGYGITDGASNTTTLTINGTTFDLSANRTWNVGTVTSVGTSGPLTGGTITGSGTIGITQAGASSDGYLSSTDWNTFNNKQNALTNPVTGTGTIFTLPMWSGATSLVDSPLSYGPDTFNFQYNSATGGTVNFTNIGLTTYTYSIQMNNFGSPRSTVHSYTDGVVVQSIGGTQVSRVFANGNTILGASVVDNGYKLEISGNLYVNSIVNATTDTDRFIVSDGGVIKYRTGSEILSDIGGQGSITLTTTGSSGPATLVGNTLNIPEYSTALTGYVPYTGANQTVNLNTQQLQAGHATFTTNGSTDTLTINHTSGSGRGIIVTKSGSGEGLTVVKSSGSGNAASITGGITLLTTLNLTNALADTYISSAANWNTAYNNRITSLTTTGTGGAATLVSHVLNIPQYQAQGNYITSLTGEATASGPGAASVTLTNSAVTGKVLTGLTVTGSSISSTDSILTAFGKLQGQVNDLIGGLQYQGTWDASTNNPTITSGVGTDGHFYIVNVAGNTTIDGVSGWQVGDWIVFHSPAWQKVDNTESVVSVNGFVGAVTLTTSNISEGTNLYFTNSRARQAISLTTTGNSGASTYDNGTGVLNVPQYTLSGLGGVPTTRALTINGVNFDLSADRTWNVGTVTSIATTGPITGGTITGSGTIGITQASGSTNGFLSSTDWNTFNSKMPAITFNSPLFIASGGEVGITQSSGSTNGFLSSTDWTTFNNKQNALTNPVTGTGTTNVVPKFTGTSTIGDSSIADNTNEVSISKRLALLGGSETILLTPNSGGTTNRLETVGTLPLALITAGSSITLAAGGTTPQFTLASTGVVTLSNLAGTGTRMVVADSSGVLSTQAIGSGSITGSGTTNYLAKFTGTSTIGNSQVFDNGTNVGIGTTSPNAKLDIGSGDIYVRTGLVAVNTIDSYNQTLTIRSNGNTAIFIPNTQNVLVGTTTDAGFKLDVNGTGRFSGNLEVVKSSNPYLIINDSGVASTGGILFQPTGFNAKGGLTLNFATAEQRLFTGEGGNTYFQTFYTNGVERLRITSGGNLGLGVTPSAGGLSGYVLFELANGGASIYSGPNQNLNGSNISWSGGTASYKISNFATLYNQQSGQHQWFNAPSGTAGNAITFTQAMTLTSGGNLLVGTTTDNGARLNVSGRLFVLNQVIANNTITDPTNDNTLTNGTVYALNGVSTINNFGIGLSAIRNGNYDIWFQTGSINGGGYRFYRGTSELVTITNGGNVGIGTSSPVERLQVYSSGATRVRIDGGGNNSGVLLSESGTNHWSLASVSGSLLFYNEVNSATRMTITSGGNVLIGTTTDGGQRLQVNGAIKSIVSSGGSVVTSESTATNGEGQFVIIGKNSSGTTRSASFKYDNADLLRIGTSSAIDFRFETNDTERMRITSGGNVLIGTTTDNGVRLQVNGGGTFLGTVSSGNGNVNGYRGFQGATGQFNTSTGLLLLGTANPGNGYIIEFQAPDGSYNYATRGAIELSGVSILYSNFSDYRLKTNIKPLASALERISNLKPVRFNLLADMKNTIDGFLAHEVQEVVPEAVNRNKDAVKENGEPDYQSLDQSKLIPLLTAAIQELKAELDELKSNN